MKILKLFKSSFENYYVVFDEIPEITYEKVGFDYVGSAVSENGDIIFSHYLEHKRWGGAFAGRELSLPMKDGTIQKIKDYWFDSGNYPAHGEFINIGAGTPDELRKCYVYTSMNINKSTFEKMLKEYYEHDKSHEYYEIKRWLENEIQKETS